MVLKVTLPILHHVAHHLEMTQMSISGLELPGSFGKGEESWPENNVGSVAEDDQEIKVVPLAVNNATVQEVSGY